jgi:two-component system, response regulator RegA
MTSLLIIDDDVIFCEVLADMIRQNGFEVRMAHDSASACSVTEAFDPEYVLLDLNLSGESGLVLIPTLLEIEPYARIVVLTGYASISTAVEAIKLGAVHYLAKPVEAQQVLDAFERTKGDPTVPITTDTPSLSRLEWEHIQTVLERNLGNISATARELGMHRRTLQRKLDKKPTL